MLQTVKTKFGTIYIETLTGEREEEDRIKIYDSKQRYLDYYSMDTIEDIAEARKISAIEVLTDEIKKIQQCDDIECFVTMLTSEWELISDNPKDIAEYLEIEYHTVLGNDYVNQIGNHYIVVAE